MSELAKKHKQTSKFPNLEHILLIYSSNKARSPPKFNQFFIVPPWTPPKMSSQPVDNFLSHAAHKQTNKPTLQKHNLLFQGGNDVM